MLHRTGQWCPGVRTGEGVVAYDMAILPPWRVPGRPTRDRCYVLPDEGVQITRPVNFTGALEGGWYVDLVDVVVLAPDRLEVRDLYADIVVPPEGAWYEVLDLDELGDAIETGVVDAATGVRVLRDMQRFIDRRLRRVRNGERRTLPEFPPAVVVELAALPELGEVERVGEVA